jgi:hypothetical protein
MYTEDHGMYTEDACDRHVKAEGIAFLRSALQFTVDRGQGR